MQKILIALLLLGLNAIAYAQSTGPNGGAMVKADDHPIEFVQRGTDIVFFVSDHDGKPLSTKGMQARATIQEGGQTRTISLKPSEPNLLVATLPAALGTNARVVFSTQFEGHALQARFTAK